MDRFILDVTGRDLNLNLYKNVIYPKSYKIETQATETEPHENTSHLPKIRFPLKWTKLNYPPIRSSHEKKLSSSFFVFDDDLLASLCVKFENGSRKLILNGNRLVPKIGRRICDSDVPPLLKFLSRNLDVISISLAYNILSDEGFKQIIDYVIVTNNIIELNLQNNDITAYGINYLSKFGEKLPLKSLRLNGNDIGIEGSKDIAIMLTKNSRLEHLDVAEIGQTESSLVYFTTVMRLDQDIYNDSLRILDISRPYSGNFDTAHIATVIGIMLRHNTCLRELHLQKYGFGCHDVECMVAGAKHNDKLEFLDLGSNNIGDLGAENLATWLRTRSALRGLVLARNILTDHGARSLTDSVPHSKLIFLDVSYNKIQDAGIIGILSTVKKSPPLRFLYIFGNCLGPSTAKIIQRLLVAEVLNQENINVKPYRVDHEWYIAYYPSDRYKQIYYDVPSNDSLQSLDALPKFFLKKFDKKSSGKIIEQDKTLKDVAASFQSDTSFVSIQSNGCMCGVGEIEEKLDKSEMQDAQYETIINMSNSNSTSSNAEVFGENEFEFDVTGKIPFILKRVDSGVRRNILRWINMNEETLEEDLAKQKQSETYADVDVCDCH